MSAVYANDDSPSSGSTVGHAYDAETAESPPCFVLALFATPASFFSATDIGWTAQHVCSASSWPSSWPESSAASRSSSSSHYFLLDRFRLRSTARPECRTLCALPPTTTELAVNGIPWICRNARFLRYASRFLKCSVGISFPTLKLSHLSHDFIHVFDWHIR
jgi:hypothetical protein